MKFRGAILMPYVRIGGRQTARPPILAKVQTDGSWKPKLHRIAAILTKTDQSIRTEVIEIRAQNSTETEWASFAMGLHLALRNGADSVGVENDNLDVIHSLMFDRKPLKQAYARHYRNEIFQIANKAEWAGVRWIPREINRAGELF